MADGQFICPYIYIYTSIVSSLEATSQRSSSSGRNLDPISGLVITQNLLNTLMHMHGVDNFYNQPIQLF